MCKVCIFCGAIKQITEFGNARKAKREWAKTDCVLNYCKSCATNQKFKFLKRAYGSICRRSNAEGKTVGFSFGWFINFSLLDANFNRMYSEMVANKKTNSHSQRNSPSVDRIIPGCIGGEYTPDNIRWLTLSENQKTYHNSPISKTINVELKKKLGSALGKRFGGSKKLIASSIAVTSKVVLKINPLTNTVEGEYCSISEAARTIGVKSQSISAAVNLTNTSGKQKMVKGFYWKLK